MVSWWTLARGYAHIVLLLIIVTSGISQTSSVAQNLSQEMAFNECMYKLLFKRGGIGVCGDADLHYFWCSIAVIFISKYSVVVFND